jgi:hypothetical protein
MTRKHQDLVSFGEPGNSLKAIPRSFGIEIDKHVIENYGKWIGVAGIIAQQREPHGKVQLLGCSPA